MVLISALLFGASTPLGKILLDSLPPFLLAGLLYLGAAMGVLPFAREKRNRISLCAMGTKNIWRLVGAIGFGGIIGPVLLLFGLKIAPAASVAMWLNLELVATALLGYILFQDHLGVYGWLGVIGTIGASLLLSWQEGAGGFQALLFLGGASFCWGLDNHLTAIIDGITPTQSTFWKGMAAGTTNIVISFLFESWKIDIRLIPAAIIVGVFAYGFSISLYILAAQNLGATRGQMIFSCAPFFGVLLSVLLLGEHISSLQIAAAGILILSLVILFRDQHGHAHAHDPAYHKHGHRHDDDHHEHHLTENMQKTHTHWHQHKPVCHSHPHWPDLHHRHNH